MAVFVDPMRSSGDFGVGLSENPVMPHGSAVANVVLAFDQFDSRRRLYSGLENIIARNTNPADGTALGCEVGDAMFTTPGTYMAATMPAHIPGCISFASFNLLPENIASSSTFVGLAEARIRPNQGQNTNSPDLAVCMHGARSTVNNGTEVIEPGDIVLALPPSAADALKQIDDPARAPRSTGLPGSRVVAVMTPMKNSYAVYFNAYGNFIPEVYAKAQLGVTGGHVKDPDAGVPLGDADDPGHPRGGAHMPAYYAPNDVSVFDHAVAAMRVERDRRPYLELQMLFPALMQQVMLENMNQVLAARPVDMRAACPIYKATHRNLIARLMAYPAFLEWAVSQWGKQGDVLAEHLQTMSAQYRFWERSVMLLYRLTIDHLESCRRFYRSKVVGRATRKSVRNGVLHLYVNPALQC